MRGGRYLKGRVLLEGEAWVDEDGQLRWGEQSVSYAAGIWNAWQYPEGKFRARRSGRRGFLHLLLCIVQGLGAKDRLEAARSVRQILGWSTP